MTHAIIPGNKNREFLGINNAKIPITKDATNIFIIDFVGALVSVNLNTK